MKKQIATMVFQVDNFDPNRPDLDEFLNGLLAEALGAEITVRRSRRQTTKRGVSIRPARSRSRRRSSRNS